MNAQQSENEFPREITFKVVYRKRERLEDEIKSVFESEKLAYTITKKLSSGEKFSSFTVGAFYESEELLNRVCTSLGSIEGYMMMV